MTERCNARSRNPSQVTYCHLNAGHKGLHWDNMAGHFNARGDNDAEREEEQREINKSVQVKVTP